VKEFRENIIDKEKKGLYRERKLSTNKNMVAASFNLRKEVTVAAAFKLCIYLSSQALACAYHSFPAKLVDHIKFYREV